MLKTISFVDIIYIYIYIYNDDEVYIYIYIYRHHHVVPLLRISLTLSLSLFVPIIHLYLSCLYRVVAGRPTPARQCERAYRRTSLFSYLFSSSVPMSCPSNMGGFRDGRKVAVQLLFWGMLLPGFVQYSSEHSCVIAV